jgi:uncharacterized protein (DUF433 family)
MKPSIRAKENHAARCDFFSRHRTARRLRPDDAWSFSDNHLGECMSLGKDFSTSYDTVLKKAAEEHPSIVMDYDVLCGSPRITGTRIPVYMVLDAVQYYGDVKGALTSYPQLTIEQVKEAISFASVVLEQPIEHEP